MIELRNVSKTFTLHNQNSAVIKVINDVSLSVGRGECVALTGSSGAGKSTLMRMIYGNYLTQSGQILIDGIDLVQAEPRDVIALRRETLGYVSQFLRVVPRVPTLDVVAEPLRAVGASASDAQARAKELLAQLNIPQRLWSLSPTTFSGGEQQRVNIARGFAHPYPAMLLDEPTASLDAANREVVLSLIEEAKACGAAIIGIFHDEAARARACDREIDVGKFTPGLSSSSGAAGQSKETAA
ncbi:Alpha-D-ribose 1-methylphosphonate 5-triphosphate synthase subunit PhnL [Nereida ignava]|uniref:Alpha-D-ribose 1-methylphosphonate 5-triphosphate synthase subunit PhnL n=1 Tax=Nereida ignava TaxID=282199 RepID=A0A0U1NN27_9RHOB|nr:phosphonate C-P lyase system protein PhnL [Nereida ignava]CRK76102.1 Alpha-D-ribose 1-methylphosphonate 5-triphosphate synthase subunit PhnL [Nereida ignava]SFJ85094.1 alpha-D-ribose 1-methylphosphonate 5-triphosphate synthase subunit PhnL [Nereida ignava DSM 16309]